MRNRATAARRVENAAYAADLMARWHEVSRAGPVSEALGTDSSGKAVNKHCMTIAWPR
jgi:hypothetical protein